MTANRKKIRSDVANAIMNLLRCAAADGQLGTYGCDPSAPNGARWHTGPESKIGEWIRYLPWHAPAELLDNMEFEKAAHSFVDCVNSIQQLDVPRGLDVNGWKNHYIASFCGLAYEHILVPELQIAGLDSYVPTRREWMPRYSIAEDISEVMNVIGTVELDQYPERLVNVAEGISFILEKTRGRTSGRTR